MSKLGDMVRYILRERGIVPPPNVTVESEVKEALANFNRVLGIEDELTEVRR